MKPDRFCRWVVLLLLLVTAAGISAKGVEPEPAPARAQGAVTLEWLQGRLAQWEGKEDSMGRGVAEAYRSAIAAHKAAEKSERDSLFYRGVIDGTEAHSDLLKGLRARRERAEEPLPTLAEIDNAELARQLDRERADYRVTRNRLFQLEADLAQQRLRPDQSARELTAAKQQLAEVEEAIHDADGVTDPGAEARAVLLNVRRRELAARIQRLELERLSHSRHMAELTARLETAASETARAEQLIQRLQDELNERHATEADEALQAVAQQLRASEPHPLLEQALERNTAYGQSLKRIAAAVDRVTREKEQAVSRLVTVRAGRERVQRQVDILGLDESLGELLRLERRRLPLVLQLRSRAEKVREAMAEMRVEAFRLEGGALPWDTPVVASEALFQALEKREARLLRRSLERAEQDRKVLRSRLLGEYARYEKSLGDLLLEYQQLIDEVEQYQRFLDRNMVWVRGGSLLTMDSLTSVEEPLVWIVRQGEWHAVARQVLERIARHPFLALLVALVTLLSVLFRRRMLELSASWTPRLGKVRLDRFRYSLGALGITLLLACGPPLPILYLGWGLGSLDESPGAVALGAGLFDATLLFMALAFCRGLLRPGGLARAHFRWERQPIEGIYQNLRWLTPLLIPLLFLVGLMEWMPGSVDRNALERLVFITLNLILALFIYRVIAPPKGAEEGVLAAPEEGRKPLQQLVRGLPAIPLGLSLLAYLGYYFGALKLWELMAQTLFLLVAIATLHGMLRRRLMIAHRRLALQRALEKRAALLESRARERGTPLDDTPEGLGVEEFDRIDLETIDGQTRAMLRLLVTVVALAGLSWMWAEIIPALKGLDEVVLWEYLSGSDPTGIQVVSLWDLMLALGVLVLTFMAANNLPGVLEIALLQPLNVETGNRYAISLISRYFIVGCGVLVSFSLIGLGWNDVQWLVAAMGVGLGFGLKEIFANFFSGLILLFERPIRIGDWVTIGELSGTVTRIRIRATTVTDWDNRELIIPNRNFLTETLNNWSLSDTITRLVIKVGIAYGSDTEKALELMQQAVMEHPETMKDPGPSVLFLGFGASALEFEIRVYIEDRQLRNSLRHDLHMRLDQLFREAGVEIAYPQQDLHLRSIDPAIRFRLE